MQSTYTAFRITAAAKPPSRKTTTRARRTVSFKEPNQELSEGMAENASAICRDSPSVANVTDASTGDLLQCGPALEQSAAHPNSENMAADSEHTDDGAVGKDSSMDSEPAEAELCVLHAEPHALGECPVQACDSASESGKKQQELQLRPGECVEAPTSVDGRSASQTDACDMGLDDGCTQLGELDDVFGNSAEEMGSPGPQREDRELATPSTDALGEESRTPVLALAADGASALEDEQLPDESVVCSELAGADPSSSDPDLGIAIAAPILPESVPSDCEVTDATQCMASSGESETAFSIKQAGIAESAAESDGLASPSIANTADVGTGPSRACDEPFEERLSGGDGVVLGADSEHIDDGAVRKDSSMDSEPAEAELCVPHAEPHALGECPVQACDSASESGKKQQELQLRPGECVEAPTSVDGRSASQTDACDMGLDDGCTQLGELDDVFGNSAEEMGSPGPQREDRELATPSTDALGEESRTPVLALAADGASALEDEQLPDESVVCSELAGADPSSSDPDLGIAIAAPILPESVPSDCEVTDATQCMASSGESETAFSIKQAGIAESAAESDGLASPSIANTADVGTGPSRACDEPFEERLSGGDGVVLGADSEHIDDGAVRKDSSMDSEPAEAELCVPHAEPHALGECPVQACDSASESGKKQQELQLRPGECVEAPTSVDGRSASQTDACDMGLDDGCTQLGELDDVFGNSAEEMGSPGPQREDRELATPSTDALGEESRTPVLALAADGASALEDEQLPDESVVCSELAGADPSSSDPDLGIAIAAPILPESVPSDCEVTDATQCMALSGESETAFSIKQAGIAESAAESDGLASPSVTNAADVSRGPSQACDEPFEERLSGGDGDVLAADSEHTDDGAVRKDSSMDSEPAEVELCVPHAEQHALGECPLQACDSASESGKKQQELQLRPGECVEAPTSVDGRSASQTDACDIGLDDGCTQLGELDDVFGNSAEEMGSPGPQREDRELATPSTDALGEESRTPVLALAADGASALEDEQLPDESVVCSELAGADPSSSDPDLGIAIAAPILPESVPSDCEVTDATQCMASSGESETAFSIKQAGIAESAAESDGLASPSVTNAADVGTGPSQACDEPFEERLSGGDGDVLGADSEHTDDEAVRKDSSMDSEPAEAELCVPHAEPHALGECPVTAWDSASESGKKQQELQLTPGECVEAPTSVDGRSASQTDACDIGLMMAARSWAS